MCPNCRAFVTTERQGVSLLPGSNGRSRIERRNPGEILGGLIPHARFTTMMILLINSALFVAEYLSPQSGITAAGQSVPAS